MSKIRLCAFADEASESIDGQIKALKRNNISLLEIRGIDGENISKVSAEKIIEVKNKLDYNGIKVWSIGSPIGKSNISDDFEKEKDLLKKICEFSSVLGSENIRIFSFYGTEKEKSFKSEVVSRLNSMVEIASSYNMDLCHENEKEIYGDTISGCLDLFENVPLLKAVFDPANFVQCEEDTLLAYSRLDKYVKYLHIKDANKNNEVVPAGEGIGNLKEIIGKYCKRGGEVISLEPHLFEFVGLKGLENTEEKKYVGKLNFTNENEAFDTGVKYLDRILNELGVER